MTMGESPGGTPDTTLRSNNVPNKNKIRGVVPRPSKVTGRRPTPAKVTLRRKEK